jgi:hypothetical protein
MEIQRVSLFRTCCTICIKSICDDYVRKCSGMVVDACSRAKFHLVRSSSDYPIKHSIKHVTAAISVRPPMITSNYGPVSLLLHKFSRVQEEKLPCIVYVNNLPLKPNMDVVLLTLASLIVI